MYIHCVRGGKVYCSWLGSSHTTTDLYLKVEPLRKRLTVDGRRVMSVFTDLKQKFIKFSCVCDYEEHLHVYYRNGASIASYIGIEQAMLVNTSKSPEERVVLHTWLPHSLAGHLVATAQHNGLCVGLVLFGKQKEWVSWWVRWGGKKGMW